MTTQTTPTTELEAVNVIIGTIGEAPISSLSNISLTDAILAYSLLQQVCRQTLAKGWMFNNEKEYPLAADVNGEVFLPTNTIQFNVSRSMGGQVDGVYRGGRIYDRENHTFTISKTVYVDITFALSFEDCPEAFRWFVTMRAARMFLDRTVGNVQMDGFAARDESDAWDTLVRMEGETAQYNILTDNPSVYSTLDRWSLNPGGGGQFIVQ